MAIGSDMDCLWVFGYGSLVWKPGFQPGKIATGHVEGYSRKFWQGNETHRGMPGRPGRVATLVEEKAGLTHGVALQLTGEEALDYLNNREMKLGGYEQQMTTFTPVDDDMKPFDVLVFVATENSRHWLGEAPEEDVAKQVVNSSGPSGHNVEYVLKLSGWLRRTFPEAEDKHLFALERHVLLELQRTKVSNLLMHCLMGSCRIEEDEVSHNTTALHQPANPTPAARSYSAACKPVALRCVKR